jgi:hypothetical protein
VVRALLVVLVALASWTLAYATGAFPWLGYASVMRRSTSLGAITVAGEERIGWEGGIEEFVFFRGQQIVIDYDVEIRKGSLYFHVFQPFDGTLGDGTSHYVTESGKGVWTLPVEATGYYHVSIGPSVLHGPGVGWDLSYTVTWGARPSTSP